MPTYYARKAGNINAADVWATTPAGTAAAVTFASGDVLMANSFNITVNVSVDLGGTGQVRNDTTGGATAGGTFTLSDNVTLTASVYNTSSIVCVTFSASAPAIANIVSDEIKCFGTINAPAINNTGSGTLTISATTISGGNAGSGSTPSAGVLSAGAGTTTVTCSGGITGGLLSQSPGVAISGSGILNIIGNVRGGATSSEGARNTSSTGGTLNITGSAIGSATSSAAGVNNTSTGTIRLTRAVGNAYGPGNTAGLAAAVGAANSGLGIIEIEQLEFGTYGQSPVSGTGIRLKKANTNVAVFNYCDTAGAKTLIDATQNAAMPAATDVRSGVSYASGAATGSCAVPAASSVAFGVPVDATTGTALLTGAAVATAVWGAATRTLTSASGPTAADNATAVWAAASRTITGGTVDTLTNAPTVPSASAIASQVRTELSVELARVDQAISSRATPANIPTSDITAIKAKTDLLETTRLAQCSTVATTGAQIAAALS